MAVGSTRIEFWSSDQLLVVGDFEFFRQNLNFRRVQISQSWDLSSFLVDILADIGDITNINRYIGHIGPVLFVFFFFCIFSQATFITDFVLNISVIYRYITDIWRFFLNFPTNDFLLQKSCREGPTPEISTIYHQYFSTFPSMVARHIDLLV